MSRARLAGIIMLLIACAAAAVLYFAPRLIYSRAGSIDVPRAEQYWQILIRFVGAPRARDEMQREGALLAPFDAHLLAHSFGAALYARFGESGFDQCDAVFAYGCYHELAGLAIAEHGFSALSGLAHSCDALAATDQFGCRHGIGHGIVASTGYTLDDLKESLDRCHSLDPTTPRDGCTDGAIMEYELRIMAGGVGNLDPRPLTAGAAFEPCDSIGARDAYACYFQAPAWWLAALPAASGVDRVRQFGELCSRLAAADRSACVEGTGFWLASALDFDTGAIARACAIAAAGSPDDLRTCLFSAARRFRSTHRPDLDTACARLGLAGQDLAACDAYAHASPTSAR